MADIRPTMTYIPQIQNFMTKIWKLGGKIKLFLFRLRHRVTSTRLLMLIKNVYIYIYLWCRKCLPLCIKHFGIKLLYLLQVYKNGLAFGLARCQIKWKQSKLVALSLLFSLYLSWKCSNNSLATKHFVAQLNNAHIYEYTLRIRNFHLLFSASGLGNWFSCWGVRSEH